MKNLLAQVGTITPPKDAAGNPIIPDPGVDPTSFVAGLIRGGIQFLLITAFIVALIWTIFAGYRFVFSGGDEKSVSGAWSQIYWGLIGLVVVVGAFAIIKLVEAFFKVNIVSGGFFLPTR
ncbi:MAG: hypothetical protein UT84_C0021G0008 [Candidatus Curtissbacteria bacterium GW2011_GWA1_40_16]|uniref:Uncharacterized protein n=1 Tax=Candidatus Curtissbacteria bacterium GW2011_GWA1_40_16 TaxID=1618405 RepID=A0A0G0UHT4_9BACT|nr:MAG: hypothetical protein UT84_C0021G0008 [Candidatus Curtissbacteria bacterium GW2011_GWA1_40_16]